MGNLNECNFIGHLGGDPEKKFTQNGMAVVNLSLGVTEKYKNRNGDQVENTTWVPLTLWDKKAELAEQYLHKGSQIYVSGKFKVDEYKDKDGNRCWKTYIEVRQFQFLDKIKQQSEQHNHGRHSNTVPTAVSPQSDNVPDDIPF